MNNPIINKNVVESIEVFEGAKAPESIEEHNGLILDKVISITRKI